jgi:predicted dehydrogenase
MSKIKCGIIGCGRIGCGFDANSKNQKILTHASSYFKDPSTDLITLCDIDKIKLKKYGKKYNITKLYQNSDDMFRNESLDCISICTMADSHLDLVKKAIKGKVKAIFLEKPIADNLSSAKKIIDLCRKNNIKLLIDHQRRFHPLYQHVRKFIKQANLGDIQLVNQYYGGGISNTGIHVFDLLRYFFGNVKSLKAISSSIKSQNPLDPNLDVQLIFMNGIQVKMQPLDTMNYGILELDIFGTKGRIRLDLTNNNIEYFKISKKESIVYTELQPINFKKIKAKKSEIYLAIENLVDCFGGRAKPICTGEDGFKSLEIAVASLISCKFKKEIELPIKHSRTKIYSR